MSDSLNSEEIQKIITNSLLAVEDAKAQKIAEQKEIERKELRKFMGYKEHDDKKGFKKKLFVFFNRTKIVFKFFFVPQHLIKGDDATFGLLKISLEMFFLFAKIVTTLLSIGIIAYILLQCIIKDIPTLSVIQNILLGLFVVPLFLFSRMFRMASIEVNKIEDRNLLFGIFASVTSIVSIVIAVIAFVIN